MLVLGETSFLSIGRWSTLILKGDCNEEEIFNKLGYSFVSQTKY
jgi:hypothetical protein